MTKQDKPVAIVTGANRGIGRAIAAGYADAGYAVADEARAAFTAPSPLGRVVDAAEVAAACTFLSSPAAASITGEDLDVNAGVAMYPAVPSDRSARCPPPSVQVGGGLGQLPRAAGPPPGRDPGTALGARPAPSARVGYVHVEEVAPDLGHRGELRGRRPVAAHRRPAVVRCHRGLLPMPCDPWRPCADHPTTLGCMCICKYILAHECKCAKGA